jgi:hypothetical protein
MPFILSSSEWSQDQWEYADEPQSFTQKRLLEAIESLHENRSVLFHPRVGLDDLAGHELVVYRSGRIEWCPKCSYDGYDPESAYLWATNDKAIELWLKLLQGDTDAIAREPWKKGYVTFCPVCGYDLGFPPWGTTGNNPYFDICPCCGTEFGADDRSWAAVGRLRELWIASGHQWFSPAKKHADWLPERQLLNLPTDLMRSWPCD